MTPTPARKGPPFWVAAVASAVALLFWSWTISSEAVELRELEELRKELSLQWEHSVPPKRGPKVVAQEAALVAEHQRSLDRICPEGDAAGEAALRAAVERFGGVVADMEVVEETPSEYITHHRTTYRVWVAPGGWGWSPVLLRLESLSTLLVPERLEILDPLNPEAVAVLDVRLLISNGPDVRPAPPRQ